MKVNSISFGSAAFVQGTPKAALYIADIAASPEKKNEDETTKTIRKVFYDINDASGAIIFPFNAKLSFIFSGDNAKKVASILTKSEHDKFVQNKVGNMIVKQTNDYTINQNMWMQAKLYSKGTFIAGMYDAKNQKVQNIEYIED